MILILGNNGGNTVSSRSSFLPQSLQRWRERYLLHNFHICLKHLFFFPVNMKRFISGIGLECSTYVVFQLMRMKMSCYGAQVLFQKAGFEVSCWTCSHGRRMRSRDMTNQESMFATMSRSVMSAFHLLLHSKTSIITA